MLTRAQQTVQVLAQMERALRCAQAPGVEGTRHRVNSNTTKIRERAEGLRWL